MLIFSEEETQTLAQRLAMVLCAGDCLTLQGDLGAGKTTFVQALVRAIAPQMVAVSSPTFTLLQTYDVVVQGQQQAVLWHYDLYRLDDEDDIEQLALDDALESGITVIEWPELVLSWLPESRISIVIEFGETTTNRNFYFDSPDDTTRRRLMEAGLC